MFSKVLIANRGEIAVRIIRACRELGIQTVAIYSEADAEALHTQLADEAICIGPAKAVDSYLNVQEVLSAAIVTKAEAIHQALDFYLKIAGLPPCVKSAISHLLVLKAQQLMQWGIKSMRVN